MGNVPVNRGPSREELLTDIAVLRAGYAQCIDDLEASNKLLVQHLGMDPVQLTGEVAGHRSVLAEIKGGNVKE